jgi:hypothetical protein
MASAGEFRRQDEQRFKVLIKRRVVQVSGWHSGASTPVKVMETSLKSDACVALQTSILIMVGEF